MTILSIPIALVGAAPFISIAICYYLNEKFWKKVGKVKFLFYLSFSLLLIILSFYLSFFVFSYPNPLNPLPHPLNYWLVKYDWLFSLVLIGFAFLFILAVKYKKV